MSFQGKIPYGSFATQMIGVWTRIRDAAVDDPTPSTLNELLERLGFLRGAVASWPAHPLERRHQQALMALIEDTVLWVKAQRDGGDVEAAERDMSETVMGVHAEVLRLTAARRSAGATPSDDGGQRENNAERS